MRNTTVHKGACSLVHRTSGIYPLFTIFAAALALVLLGTSVCLAQTQFAFSLGGATNDERGTSLAQTYGGYVITGGTGFGAGSEDLFFVKINSSGEVEWSRAVGGTDYDEGTSLAQTYGGYIITGGTGFGAGNGDLSIVKFNSSGEVEWSRAIGGTNDDYGNSIVHTYDGGFAAAGYTNSFGAGNGDLFFVKWDSMGTYEWSRTVGGTDYDWGNSVVQTSDSGYAVTGCTYSFGAGNGDLFITKINPSGEIEWSRTVGGTDCDEGYSVVQSSDGGYAVTGGTYSFGAGNGDLFFVKWDSMGTYEWSRTVGGTNDDEGYSVVQTSDGGYAVTGSYNFDFSTGTGDLFITKINPSGEIVWSRTVGGTNGDEGKSVVQTSDGGYAVTGNYNFDFSTGLGDLFLVKFDSEGNCCIGEDISPTVTDVSPTVTDVSPTVMDVSPTVTDFSPTVTVVTPDVDTICTELEIAETVVKPQGFEISTTPNPFNSSVAITAPAGAKVEIYDINGNVVVGATRCVAQQEGDETHRPYIWTPDKSLSSGIYFVRAKMKDGQQITKRLVYIR